MRANDVNENGSTTEVKCESGVLQVKITGAAPGADIAKETSVQDVITTLGTPVADVSTDIAGVKTVVDSTNATVTNISNVVRLNISVPPNVSPEASDHFVYIEAYLYDNSGNLEAPDADLAIKVFNESGTDRSGNLYKDGSGAAGLDASAYAGYKAMVNASVGKYYMYYKVAAGATVPEYLTFENYWVEGGKACGNARNMRITDEETDLNDIKTAVQTDIPADITAAHSTTDGKIDTVQTNLGSAASDTLKSANAKIGDIARSIDLILGGRWDSSGDLGTDVLNLLTNLGDASAHTLKSANAKIGDIARTVDLLLGSRWDSSGDLGTDVALILSNQTPSGIAWSLKVNNLTTRTDFQSSFNDAMAVLGCDNTNVFNPTIQGSARTDLDAALTAIDVGIGNASGHTLVSTNAKIGDIARTLDLILGARWDSAGDLGTDIALLLSNQTPAGVAWSLKINNLTTRTDFQNSFNDAMSVLGCDDTNVFGPQIQGVASASVNDAFQDMASYFVTNSGALNRQVNNNTARSNFDLILNDFFAVIGCDNANVFNPSIQGSARTTLESALFYIDDGIGDGHLHALPGINTKIGDLTRSLDLMLGARWDSSGDLGTDIGTLLTDTGLIKGDIGDASAATLGSIYGILGNPATAISTSAASAYQDVITGGGTFSAPAAANPGDNIALYQVARAIVNSLMGDDDYDGYTAFNNVACTSLDGVMQALAGVLGCASTNTFSSTIMGSARTALDTALGAQAEYFVSMGGAWSLQMNNLLTAVDLRTTMSQFFSVLGCDGTNVFNPSIQGSARTTVEDAFAALGTGQGNMSADTLTSVGAKIGNIARSIDLIMGARWDSSGDLGTDILALLTNLGDMSGDSLVSVAAKLGNDTATVKTRFDNLDAMRAAGGDNYAVVSKTITYDGSVSYPAFTVTGMVKAKVIGYITSALSNHGDTTSVGTATSAAGLIAATAGSVMQTANQIWIDVNPSKFVAAPTEYLIGDGEDIAVTSTANLATGTVVLYCFYTPISAGASVAAA